MTELEKYEAVNKSSTLKELADVLRSFAIDGMIQGRTRKFDAEKMAEHCESYHLAVEKDVDGIYTVQTFKIDNNRLDLEKSRLLSILGEIKKEKDFSPRDVSWDNAILLGGDNKQLQNITGINSLPLISI